MPSNQLNRLVWRQDQILQLPFPKPPSLARHIQNGVLKKEGAAAYDIEQQKDREAIQNVLKQFLRWPKLEEWQQVVTNVTNVTTNVTNITTTVTQSSADLTALTTAVTALTSRVATLESSVTNLTNAINQAIEYRIPQRGFGQPADQSPVPVGRFDGDEYWDMSVGPPGTYRWNLATLEWYSM